MASASNTWGKLAVFNLVFTIAKYTSYNSIRVRFFYRNIYCRKGSNLCCDTSKIVWWNVYLLRNRLRFQNWIKQVYSTTFEKSLESYWIKSRWICKEFKLLFSIFTFVANCLFLMCSCAKFWSPLSRNTLWVPSVWNTCKGKQSTFWVHANSILQLPNV